MFLTFTYRTPWHLGSVVSKCPYVFISCPNENLTVPANSTSYAASPVEASLAPPPFSVYQRALGWGGCLTVLAIQFSSLLLRNSQTLWNSCQILPPATLTCYWYLPTYFPSFINDFIAPDCPPHFCHHSWWLHSLIKEWPKQYLALWVLWNPHLQQSLNSTPPQPHSQACVLNLVITTLWYQSIDPTTFISLRKHKIDTQIPYVCVCILPLISSLTFLFCVIPWFNITITVLWVLLFFLPFSFHQIHLAEVHSRLNLYPHILRLHLRCSELW